MFNYCNKTQGWATKIYRDKAYTTLPTEILNNLKRMEYTDKC